MLRIATVDDNPADLKEIRMCLSHYFQKRSGQTPIDYTISAYTSGPSFLENFEKGDYDLILLDIYMPRMTGMQVAEEIRTIDEDAWIIFLTTSRDHALESYNVFASGYVLKPLLENAPQLETLLTRLLPEDSLAAKTLTVKLAGGECLSVPTATSSTWTVRAAAAPSSISKTAPLPRRTATKSWQTFSLPMSASWSPTIASFSI